MAMILISLAVTLLLPPRLSMPAANASPPLPAADCTAPVAVSKPSLSSSSQFNLPPLPAVALMSIASATFSCTAPPAPPLPLILFTTSLLSLPFLFVSSIFIVFMLPSVCPPSALTPNAVIFPVLPVLPAAAAELPVPAPIPPTPPFI